MFEEGVDNYLEFDNDKEEKEQNLEDDGFYMPKA